MPPFLTTFEIRWNDLDANRHVANASFAAFMTHTRMTYLGSKGIDNDYFQKHSIGPAILQENFHYLKEIHPSETVKVDVQLLGLSPDGIFTKFSHSLFNQEGKLAVYSTLLFVWINLKTRKMQPPPPELKEALASLSKAEGYKEITREELRSDEVPRHRRSDPTS